MYVTFPAALLQPVNHTQSKPMSCCLCSSLLTSADTTTHTHTYTRGTDTPLPHLVFLIYSCAFFPKYFTSQLLFHALSECVSACLRETHRQKGRTKGLRTRSKEQKERKREGGMRRSGMREGTRKRKCFVCGCFVRMNASMHRHACLYRVNTHVLVESVPGAKQIDGEDKQTDRIISVPITPRPASVSQLLSLSLVQTLPVV